VKRERERERERERAKQDFQHQQDHVMQQYVLSGAFGKLVYHGRMVPQRSNCNFVKHLILSSPTQGHIESTLPISIQNKMMHNYIKIHIFENFSKKLH
jgi:hypothetical protein